MSKMKGIPCCLGLIYCLAFLFVPAKCGVEEPSELLMATTKEFDGLEPIVIYQGGSGGMVVYGEPDFTPVKKYKIQYDATRDVCVASQPVSDMGWSPLCLEFGPSFIGENMPDGITFYLADQLKLFVWLMPSGHLTLRMPDGSAQNFSAIMQHGKEAEIIVKATMIEREKKVVESIWVNAPKVADVFESDSIKHFLITLNEKDEFLELFTVMDGMSDMLSFEKGSGVFTVWPGQSKIVGIDMDTLPKDLRNTVRFVLCSRDGKSCERVGRRNTGHDAPRGTRSTSAWRSVASRGGNAQDYEPSKQLIKASTAREFSFKKPIAIYQGGSSGIVVYGEPDFSSREKFKIQYDATRDVCVASQPTLDNVFCMSIGQSSIGKMMPDGITFHLRDQLKLFVWLMPFGHLTLKMPNGSTQNFSAIMQHGREAEVMVKVMMEREQKFFARISVNAPKVADVFESDSIKHFLITLNEKDEFLELFTVMDGTSDMLSFDKGSGVFTVCQKYVVASPSWHRDYRGVGIDMTTLPTEEFRNVTRFAICSRDGMSCRLAEAVYGATAKRETICGTSGRLSRRRTYPLIKGSSSVRLSDLRQ